MLKVAVVDDHQLFRESLTFLINSFKNIKVVLEARDGKNLFELLPGIAVDLVLLDIQMPEMNGYETCDRLRIQYPDLKIIILSQVVTNTAIQKLLGLGADGFFSKNSDPSTLENALRNISKDGFFLALEPGLLQKQSALWKKSTLKSGSEADVYFTHREIEVISLACAELNSIQIADRLCINVRTVDSHRKRIMEKTKTKNFVGAIIYALREGLVNPGQY